MNIGKRLERLELSFAGRGDSDAEDARRIEHRRKVKECAAAHPELAEALQNFNAEMAKLPSGPDDVKSVMARVMDHPEASGAATHLANVLDRFGLLGGYRL